MHTRVNGTPNVIGFFPNWSYRPGDEWMANEDIRATINDIHVRVIRLDEQRVADVNEVASLRLLVDKLEGRLWLAVAATAATFGTAILGLLM